MADTYSVETYQVESGPDFNDVIFAQRYDINHDKIGDPIQVTTDDIDASAVSALVLTTGGFVVTYNFVNPHDVSTPFPLNYLATREFTPDGTVLTSDVVSLNDFNTSVSVTASTALDDGAYAMLYETFIDNSGAFSDDKTLRFVDGEGNAKSVLLFSTGHGDGPFAFLSQNPGRLEIRSDHTFAVSWSATYIGGSPEYPPAVPPPTGSEQFTYVYRDDGSLVSTLFIDFNHATDLVTSTISRTLTRSLLNLDLIGNDRISGIGNALNNTLNGNDNKNHLVGLGGEDRLDGHLGTDYLEGGAGADVFVFSTAIKPAFNSDLIADFSPGMDRIELSSAIFTGLPKGALAATSFVDVADGATPTASSRIIYDSAGNLLYDADGSGHGAASQFATLAGHPDLSASDFAIV